MASTRTLHSPIERLRRNDKTLRLVALHYPKEKRGSVSFETSQTTTEIQGANRLLRWLLGRCDGRTPIVEAFNDLSIRRQKQARELLAALIARGIVHTPHSLPQSLHRLTSGSHPMMLFPMRDRDVIEITEVPRYSHASHVHSSQSFEKPNMDASPFLQLLSRRASTRSVPASAERTDIQTLINICRAGYGNVGGVRKTVASAGALWPLTLFCAEPLHDTGRQFHLWWYDDNKDIAGSMGTISKDQLLKCFSPDPFVLNEMLSTGSGVIFVAADLTRVAAKYGARAYRFALIESGAAFQNMQLFAVERGFTSRTYGGVVDESISSVLRLPESCIPICAFVVGRAQW